MKKELKQSKKNKNANNIDSKKLKKEVQALEKEMRLIERKKITIGEKLEIRKKVGSTNYSLD